MGADAVGGDLLFGSVAARVGRLLEVLVMALAAGLVVGAAIEQVNSGVNVDLKWPNDVLIGGRKVCGILTEMNAEVTRVRYVVVGVGINVNHVRFPKEIEGGGHLAAHGDGDGVVAGGVGGGFVKIARPGITAC